MRRIVLAFCVIIYHEDDAVKYVKDALLYSEKDTFFIFIYVLYYFCFIASFFFFNLERIKRKNAEWLNYLQFMSCCLLLDSIWPSEFRNPLIFLFWMVDKCANLTCQNSKNFQCLFQALRTIIHQENYSYYP